MTQDPPITQADRELLDAETYSVRKRLQISAPDGTSLWTDEAALRAIAKARQLGREQGLREAVTACEESKQFRKECGDFMIAVGCSDCREAILALIDKPGGAV